MSRAFRVTVALSVASIALTGCSSRPGADDGGVTPSDQVSAPTGAEAEALAILRDWDARRAEAWAGCDRSGLRKLYTAGSSAGRRDRSMLAAYLRRGLRIEGLRTQVLAVRVLRRSGRTLALEVTDRTLTAGVLGAGIRAALPVDEPTVWTVVLRRIGGEWRMAAVRGAVQRSAAARTS